MERNKAATDVDDATGNLFGMEKGCAAPAARDIVMMMCSFVRSPLLQVQEEEGRERVKAASLTKGTDAGARKSWQSGWLKGK